MLAIVPPHYVGKSPILDGHVMVSIEGSRVTLVFAEEVSKDRDYVEQSVEITKWQARRLLLQLSHKLDFSVPVETYDRIHNDRV